VKNSFQITTALLRLILSAALVGITLAASSAASAAPPASPPPGKPLDIGEFGTFFVGGQTITTPAPSASATATPGRVVVNQMFVEYYIPKGGNTKVPVVMVHGSNHLGTTWMTTPDGREGWASYFLRAGHPVYIVDVAGRGRSSWDSTNTNLSKVQNNPALNPGFSRTTYESAFSVFRLGPSPNVFWPDTRFPVASYDQYQAQLVPNTDSSLPAPRLQTSDDLIALVHKIGPAVLMGHSFGTQYAVQAGFRDPTEVAGVINLEGTAGHVCNLSPAELDSYKTVPQLTVFADHIAGSIYVTGFAQCSAQIDATNAAGGDGTFLSLPAIGITGNSHMMMMENNNLQIADLILNWIDTHVGSSRAH
jgi:pimeloyl-ACP methyl ester carboxylesterase